MYLTFRDDMQTGDALQWKSNSFIGWAIRKKTKGDVNHTSMVINLTEFGTDRRFCIEALDYGIDLNLVSRRLKNFDGEVYWHPLINQTEETRIVMGRYALGTLGIPYDYKSIFKQIFGKVSADAKQLFCSEMLYLAAVEAGFSKRKKAPTPADIPNLGWWAKQGQRIK